jgi:triosephosphate isomerase
MATKLPPLVAVSLKMYLSAAETRAWVRQVADIVADVVQPGRRERIEVAVLPTFPLLESTAATLAATTVRWGAQDVAAAPDGDQTGEVSVDVLAELGCRYVEVGHAERRRLFGETREAIGAKLEQVVGAGLVPIYCLGETERCGAGAAARACRNELDDVLTTAQAVSPDPEVVVAYEPLWAIGAAEPAPADHVSTVCTALQDTVRGRRARARVIYGGSAGPGTYTDLRGCTDGLFLGRFAHDPSALAQVIDEVLTAEAPRDSAEIP